MDANITPYLQALQEYKLAYWTWLMAKAGGNVSLAAKLAGLNRTHVYKLVHSLNIAVCPRHVGNWGDLSNDEPPPRYSPPA